MANRRQHWIDRMADEIRDRVRTLIPAVAEVIHDEVPVGYKPPPPRQSLVDQFLSMQPDERLAWLASLSPREYRATTTKLMNGLMERFGPAAERLLPAIQGMTYLRQLTKTNLPDILGYDPFAGSFQHPGED